MLCSGVLCMPCRRARPRLRALWWLQERLWSQVRVVPGGRHPSCLPVWRLWQLLKCATLPHRTRRLMLSIRYDVQPQPDLQSLHTCCLPLCCTGLQCCLKCLQLRPTGTHSWESSTASRQHCPLHSAGGMNSTQRGTKQDGFAQHQCGSVSCSKCVRSHWRHVCAPGSTHLLPGVQPQ